MPGLAGPEHGGPLHGAGAGVQRHHGGGLHAAAGLPQAQASVQSGAALEIDTVIDTRYFSYFIYFIFHI